MKVELTEEMEKQMKKLSEFYNNDSFQNIIKVLISGEYDELFLMDFIKK